MEKHRYALGESVTYQGGAYHVVQQRVDQPGAMHLPSVTFYKLVPNAEPNADGEWVEEKLIFHVRQGDAR